MAENFKPALQLFTVTHYRDYDVYLSFSEVMTS